MTVRVGDVATWDFVIREDAMRCFQALSADRSGVHTNETYARTRGYEGVIVYGGLMIAQLSYVLGMKVPGPHALSSHWSIAYRAPLYVDEPATLVLEVIHVSKALGIAEARFRITAGDRLVATGSTQSVLPSEEIEED